MYVEGVESAPGSVAQVRASAQLLIAAAKRAGASLLLVGHVTKDGAIAGPRVLEHMVDAVLYFEGDTSQHYRILRAVKNRFGPADALGVFEMTGLGLAEVPNPSALFVGEREGREPVTGSAVFAGFRGARPLLVEVQALVGAPGPASPRRAVVGWDSARLAMTLSRTWKPAPACHFPGGMCFCLSQAGFESMSLPQTLPPPLRSPPHCWNGQRRRTASFTANWRSPVKFAPPPKPMLG